MSRSVEEERAEKALLVTPRKFDIIRREVSVRLGCNNAVDVEYIGVVFVV